jgi:hypothetical protein
MPAELDSCVEQVLAKQPELDESNAYAICNASLGGSNFASFELDGKGDLYLKYFLADSTFAKNTAVGDFSLDGAAIAAKDKEAIGLPFSILPSRDLSIFGDYHPWNPDLKATWQDHVAFAKDYSPGHIVAVSSTSRLGAATDALNNGGRFAVVKITDQRTRDAYMANPSLIPKAVSPGIMNLEAPNKTGIKNFKWAHLAAVPQGAYGEKARLYASCLGGDQCVNTLIAAGVAQKARITNYCPVGASESLAQVDTSLFNSSAKNSVELSANTTNNPTSNVNPNNPSTLSPQSGISSVPNSSAASSPQSVVANPVGQPQQQVQTGSPIKTEVLRLKGQQGQQGQMQQPQVQNVGKLEALEKKLAEIEEREMFNEKVKHARELIDMRLFVINGKYNQKEHEAAIEEAAKSNWSDDQIARYYGGLLKIKDWEEQNTSNPQNSNNKRLGGSVYQTPSNVPELTGAGIADIDMNTFRTQKVKGLVEMFGLGGRI